MSDGTSDRGLNRPISQEEYAALGRSAREAALAAERDALKARVEALEAELAQVKERNWRLASENEEAKAIQMDNLNLLRLLSRVSPMYGPLHNCLVCGADPEMGEAHLDWCAWHNR